jgi:uncharacterized protein DUF1064
MANNRSIQLSKLGPAALAQIEAHIGPQALKKHLKSESKTGAGQGRIRVSPAAERTVDGHVFASKWEMETYLILKTRLGLSAFSLQPEFVLLEKFTDAEGKKHRSIVYRADFLIGPPRDNNTDPVLPGQIIVDSKGMETEVFKMKRKMFLARYRSRLYLPRSKSELSSILDQL